MTPEMTPPEVTDEMLRAAGYECSDAGSWRYNGASMWSPRAVIVDEYKARQQPTQPESREHILAVLLLRMLIKVGVLREDAEATGPLLVMAAEDYLQQPAAPKPPDCEAGVELSELLVKHIAEPAQDGRAGYEYWRCELCHAGTTKLPVVCMESCLRKQIEQAFATLTAKLAAAEAAKERAYVRMGSFQREANAARDQLAAREQEVLPVAEIHDWQKQTFPHATRESKYEHLTREIRELGDDLSDASEIADCLLLLIGIACIQRIDPVQAVRDKFEVNKARQWGKPDANGVVEHVREAALATAASAESKP